MPMLKHHHILFFLFTFDDIETATFSLALGEDSVPKYVFLDDGFEELPFPDFLQVEMVVLKRLW